MLTFSFVGSNSGSSLKLVQIFPVNLSLVCRVVSCSSPSADGDFLSRARCACVAGSARGRSQCFRAQLYSKALHCPLLWSLRYRRVYLLVSNICVFFFNQTQKPLVSHSYKNLMTFGGCRQDFMLVLGHSVGANSTRDKPTEKHLFSMDSSKVRHTHTCADVQLMVPVLYYVDKVFYLHSSRSDGQSVPPGSAVVFFWTCSLSLTHCPHPQC